MMIEEGIGMNTMLISERIASIVISPASGVPQGLEAKRL
jgi:hypothetical protein